MKYSIIAATATVTTMLVAPAASASEALPQAVAQRLDARAAEFTMTAAKERRLMMIEQSIRQQRRNDGRYGRPYGREYGGPGYGHRRPYGGPPPYGYRRHHYERW